MTHDRRLIEETFPVKDVGAESAREKNIRHGHIRTLHLWWACRDTSPSARLEPEEMVEVRYRVWVEEILAGAGEKE